MKALCTFLVLGAALAFAQTLQPVQSVQPIQPPIPQQQLTDPLAQSTVKTVGGPGIHFAEGQRDEPREARRFRDGEHDRFRDRFRDDFRRPLRRPEFTDRFRDRFDRDRFRDGFRDHYDRLFRRDGSSFRPEHLRGHNFVGPRIGGAVSPSEGQFYRRGGFVAGRGGGVSRTTVTRTTVGGGRVVGGRGVGWRRPFGFAVETDRNILPNANAIDAQPWTKPINFAADMSEGVADPEGIRGGWRGGGGWGGGWRGGRWGHGGWGHGGWGHRGWGHGGWGRGWGGGWGRGWRRWGGYPYPYPVPVAAPVVVTPPVVVGSTYEVPPY